MGRYAPSLTTGEHLHPSRNNIVIGFSRAFGRAESDERAGAQVGLGGIAVGVAPDAGRDREWSWSSFLFG
jgi:hypothetical protein